jgi:RHS repeat-associated protein
MRIREYIDMKPDTVKGRRPEDITGAQRGTAKAGVTGNGAGLSRDVPGNRPRRYTVCAPVPGTGAFPLGRSGLSGKCAPPSYEGQLYEHIEYTPYGELWIERTTNANNKTPYRFTGKEFDEETGLYYYGARYLNPQTSMWLSADPAMGEYIPRAPIDDDARKYNQNLPGMGGVFNYINLHTYHYAGNNPVKYVDPDGEKINTITSFDQQNVGNNAELQMGDYGYNTVGLYGCLFTAVVNIGNTIRQSIPNISTNPGNPARPLSDYNAIRNGDDLPKYFTDTWNGTTQEFDALMNTGTITSLLNDMTDGNLTVTRVDGNSNSLESLDFFSNSKLSNVYIVANVGGHYVNVDEYQGEEFRYHDPFSSANGSDYKNSDIQGLIIIERLR